jgi:hypothetical protein
MFYTEQVRPRYAEEFGSYEQAGEFWDMHSITDYEESLESADLDVDIQRRHFEIEVDEESFLALRETASGEQKPALAPHHASNALSGQVKASVSRWAGLEPIRPGFRRIRLGKTQDPGSLRRPAKA